MADYKEIFTGALSGLAGKVKNAAESSGILDVYQKGADRAVTYGKVVKLTLESNADAEELKRIYTEIGRLYYEQAKDAPEGFFAPLFAQAKEITERIARREDEIAEARSSVGEKNIDMEIGEFEDIIDATENQGKGGEE